MVLASAVALGRPAARAARPTAVQRILTQSFLVATFFNNFLPSNIGGDVDPDHRHREGGRLEDAGDDRRADRSGTRRCSGWR